MALSDDAFRRVLGQVTCPSDEIHERNARCNRMALVGRSWYTVFAPRTGACSPESTRCVVLQGALGLQVTQIAQPWWRWVNVASSRATNATPAALAASCPHLTDLDLSGCYDIGDEGLCSLAAGCPAITTLDLGDCDVGDEGLRSLAAGCPAIHTLILSNCFSFSGKLLGLLGALVTLKLDESDVDDEGMKNLSNTLKALNLMNCEAITNTGLGSLADRCPNLTSLCLAGCVQVTDAGMVSLASGCLALRYVDLRGCPLVGEPGLKLLALLPSMCSVQCDSESEPVHHD